MDQQPRSITKYHLIFDLAVLALSAAATVGALDFPRLARTFPLAAAGLATLLAVAVLVLDVRRYARGIPAVAPADPAALVAPAAAEPEDGVSPRRVLVVSMWLLGYVAGIALIGLPAATIAFLLGSLVVEGKLRFWVAALLTAFLMVWLLVLADLLGLRMPPSLIDLYGILTTSFN